MNDFDPVLDSSPVLRLIFLLAAVGAIVFAQVAKRRTVRAVGWGVAYVFWFTALFAGGVFWDGGFATVVCWALLGFPAVALVAASWLLPRGRPDTITAEIGLLVLILFSQWIVVFSFSSEPTYGNQPVQILIWFLFLAVAFIAAAIPVPTRRIAYGAAALTCVLLGFFREVLLWSETGQNPDVPFNDDILVGIVYFGIPVIGAVLQLLWWAKLRRLAVSG